MSTAVANQPSAPTAHTVARRNASGNLMGHRTTFSGQRTAGDIRTELKLSGIKGKALTKAVESTLRGETDVRCIVGQAYVSALIQKGFVPNFADTNKAGDVATMKFIKVNEAKVDVTELSQKERETLLADLLAAQKQDQVAAAMNAADKALTDAEKKDSIETTPAK